MNKPPIISLLRSTTCSNPSGLTEDPDNSKTPCIIHGSGESSHKNKILAKQLDEIGVALASLRGEPSIETVFQSLEDGETSPGKNTMYTSV